MAYNEDELTPADLAAFDLMIAVLQEEGKSTVNLRELVMGASNDAMQRYRAAQAANRQARQLRQAARQIALAPHAEPINVDDLTLGQLNIELSLAELMEMKRQLEA